MEAASEKLRKRRYDLIVWNACSDSAGGIDLTSSLDFLSGKAPGAKAIVFTAREMAHGSLPCDGHIALKKHPSSEEEFLSVIESSLPVTSYGALTRGAHDEAGVRIEFEGMITVGLAMRPVIRRIIDAAAVDIPGIDHRRNGNGKRSYRRGDSSAERPQNETVRRRQYGRNGARVDRERDFWS